MDLPTKRSSSKHGNSRDGGYGWFVLLAAFFVYGLIFGIIKSFGVFYVQICLYFSSTATEMSWITSISLTTIYICAPIGTAMSALYGHRAVVMAGGALVAVGMVTGSLSQDLIQLYFTVGFLSGLGYALIWTPTLTMLTMYFDRRQPLANGLASSGECIITFLIPPFFQLLLDWYSWRGAMLILAGMELNVLVCGALLRPLPSMEDSTRDSIIMELERSSKNLAKRPQLKEKVLQYIDYTLITDKHFMVYTISAVMSASGFFAPAVYLVPYAQSQGLEEYRAATLMSISAACDLGGRLACSWLAHMRLMDTIKLMIIVTIMQGVVLLFCPLASSFTELAIFSVIYGLTFGGIISVSVTVLADTVGKARMGSAISISMLFRSIGGLLGPFVAGVFTDKIGSYGAGFLVAGVAFIVSAILLIILHLMNRKEDTPQPE